MINLSSYYKSADGSNLIFNNGNSNGADIVIGTNDNYNLALEANGIKKLILTQDSLSGNISKTSFGAGSATGLNSFAIGLGKAFGAYSHAEGYYTIASGQGSHAEGVSNTASGIYSHAEGDSNTASGQASHAEGNSTTASGPYSHAEGIDTTASGPYSHAEGNSNTASGPYSHAEGDSNTASGTASHAEGNDTSASGPYSHTEGSSTATGRRNAFLTYTAATQTFTFANTVSANFSFASPGTLLRGYEDYELGTFFNIVVASRSNITGDIVATTDEIGANSNNGYLFDNAGTFSHAEGDTTVASGQASHAEGGNTTASGNYSHAEGTSTTASGANSHAEGVITTARGNTSHAAGSYAEAAHDRSWIWKGSTATNIISTTRTDQFMVSAAGGVYIPGNVGIGTAANDRALTIAGSVSGSSTITGYNIAAQNQVQYLSSGVVKVYQYYNTTTNSLDTVFS